MRLGFPILSGMRMFQEDFRRAFKASIPVLLGYVTIGFGFGLLAVNSGYPPWLALFMSVVVYAGAAQYIGIGLFAAGATVPEIVLITLVANIRHAAYGLSLISRYARHPAFRPYLVFALTDETFALISSQDSKDKDRGAFLLFVSAMNQLYWVAGTCLGAFAGSLATERIEGLDFALTAMFIVLAVEQALKLRKAFPFVLAAVTTIGAKVLLGDRFAIIAGLAAALLAAFLLEPLSTKTGTGHA
ncbi:MAG: branched-chain amino acid transport protein AzlC [Spirochaetes bacterium]|nr:MAG: branched-chain amino acid transport protein AzlC [Spirochaetota bacterium]